MLKYWIWLSTLTGLGRKAMRAVLSYFKTPEAAFFADRAEYALVPGLTEQQIEALCRKELTQAEEVLFACSQKHIRILTYQDAAYPERLRNIDDPPMVLYYVGTIPEIDANPVIGMVGSRQASAYGLLQAKKFGYQLSRCGAIVVSGMARGIDTMSLEGALTAGTPVIGVLGCGLDVVYPRENRNLYRDVAMHGCLLTEYIPGTPPAASNFPVRNRIISGLSVGVLVVEAGKKSGALITASRALEQGRDVFAVPSNLDVSGGEGTNQLIHEGAALVTSGWDVLREYTALFPDKIIRRSGGDTITLQPRDLERSNAATDRSESEKTVEPAENGKKPVDKSEERTYIDLEAVRPTLSADEAKVAELLTEKPVHVDELIERSGLAASQALAALTLLEIKGITARMPGRRYRLAEKGI